MKPVTTFTDSLLPCPFCGGKPKTTHIGNDQTLTRKLTIACPGCGASMTQKALRFSFAELEQTMLIRWNQRKEES